MNWDSKYRNQEKVNEWIANGGRQVLELLSRNGEMTRSQLMVDLGVQESTLDKFLGTIRSKIYTIQAGKARWYTLR